MTATTAHLKEAKKETGQLSPISKEDFLREYSDMEDGFKYEWNNGIIEKTLSMKQDQLIIQSILLRIFINTRLFMEGGLLTSEGNMDTTPTQLRKPDLAIYTGDQLKTMTTGENQVALWVAEVVSDNDNANKINDKIEEYFNAGVQVVWIIYPHSKQVNVYTAIDKSTICRGKTVCSGAPAIGGFEIAAEELFA